MIFPKITALLAAYLAVVMSCLVFKVVKTRRRYKVELEAGGHDELTRAVRAHGNLVETTPIFLILLAFIEIAGANIFIILSLALIFGLSRSIHPIGMSGRKGTFKWRKLGMAGSLFSIIGAVCVLVFHVLILM